MARKVTPSSRNSSSTKPLKRESGEVSPVRRSPLPKPQPQVQSRQSAVTHEMIAERAYLIWESSGGSEFDNWLRAERELRGI